MNNYTTSLYDEKTFYQAFIRDLKEAKTEVIIESPFVTSKRIAILTPILKELNSRGVKIFIITRDPREHNKEYSRQSEVEITAFEVLGIQVFLCRGNHHRKLAIIDRRVLWEGSLNILSQIRSREIMRRLKDGDFAMDMFNFLNFKKYI